MTPDEVERFAIAEPLWVAGVNALVNVPRDARDAQMVAHIAASA